MEPLLTFLRDTGAMEPTDAMMSRTAISKHLNAYFIEHNLQVNLASTAWPLAWPPPDNRFSLTGPC